MPFAVTPQRRGRHEDADGEESDIDGTSSRSTKRSRLNGKGDATPSQTTLLSNGDHLDTDRESTQEGSHSETATLPYLPGSIVRVKLINFVTYTNVEFYPGPSLNMVIGPNGTGKSTLVCAICLGLGWGPQHLGRAKEVHEFVKHGSQEATVEIELAAWPRKRNPVIRCVIRRESNKSVYYINGTPSNKKKVVELARSFSIQIDNLCQFLPQDKVVEFAAMTPVELLRSTQRAVASEEMLEWHESLKVLRSDQRTVQQENVLDLEMLAGLERRQRMQEADVERMREREEIVERVRLLEYSRPYAEYREKKDEYLAAKERMKDATKELNELEQEVEPTLHAVNTKQNYRDRMRLHVDGCKGLLKKAENNTETVRKKLNGLQDRVSEIDKLKEAEKKGNQVHKGELQRLQGIITRLGKQLEEPPIEFDVAAINENIRQKGRDIAAHIEEGKELKQTIREWDRNEKDRNDRIQQAERHVQDLESQAGQQNEKLRKVSRNSEKAWEWIQRHQDQFEKHVYGPPIVECSVKDARYVDLIEAVFSKSDYICFTVQTRADFTKLHTQLTKIMGLSEISIRTMSGSLENFRSPVGEQEMKRFGLDGWIIDYMTGPDVVLAMLCSDGPRIQQTALALRDTTSQEYELIQNSPIACWVTRKSVYKINRRREYGASATSTQVRDFRQAQIWTDRPVDMSAKRDLEENISGWTEEAESFRTKIADGRTELVRLGDLITNLEEEKKSLEEDKQARQKATNEFNALPIRKAQAEEKLATVQSMMGGVRERFEALEKDQDTLVMDKGQATLDFADAVDGFRKAHDELFEAEFMLVEAISDVEVLTERNGAVKEKLEARRREVEELSTTLSRAATLARNLGKLCKEKSAQADDATRAFLRTIDITQSVEDVDAEIESEKARLELMHEGNGSVIREYEHRQKKIDSLKAHLKEVEVALAELTGQVKEIQEKWEPQLDKLVNRISRSFAFNMKQINCAGEVSVSKDEDFSQWAIQIQVKFRENEPLTVLDSHRQSGGERAVSTIFYLMSLQSLTRSPFRVVDEINQGMDPRNERLVHARMVSIATGNDEMPYDAAVDVDENEDGDDGARKRSMGGGSQYFLITPKLLHGLRYERGMRVLCIASGEYMPRDQSCVDFRACVDLRRRLVGGGG